MQRQKVRSALANAEDYLLYALEYMRSDGCEEEELVELETAIRSIRRLKVLGGCDD